VIEEIRISSLGVIEESVLELGPGLSVITGETGAGKTMLVTALGLLLGARADSGAVRTGARAARIDGVVRVAVDDEAHDALAAAVDEVGGELEDGTLLLGRQVTAEGRSRAFVGGAAVPVSALGGLADRLVAVHGQSDQHRLLRPEAQRAALDQFAGPAVAGPLADYADRFTRLRDLEAELHEVRTHARERAREADLLRLGLEEVEQVAPQPGEDVALAAEEARLGHVDTLRTAAEDARTALSADTIASDAAATDATGAVARARHALDGVREHDPEAAALADRLAELSYLLADLAADVASYATSVETDPARLAAVSQRRAALTSLTRKYGETVDEVLAWSATAAGRVLELDTSEERIVALEAQGTALRAELTRLAGALTAARTEAAARLAASVTAELGALSMPDARLEVVVREAGRFTPTGVDEVEILLTANTGMEARPLHRGASGGELSRVMLGLEVVLADTRAVPTFVFDEVDAGVGGKAAVEVGRRLAALARNAQVLVVTHLPQVAAFADRHVVVRKSGDGSVTTSGLAVLDDAGRVQELSRMLAGLEQSDTARAHARELLAMARASG
jgi:DNA repair protein RecN (Recombination protein N)